MSDPQKDHVFKVVCPCCQSVLWVDENLGQVIQSEKARKKKGNLEDLLARQIKKTEEADQRFEATFELQKQKKENAEEKFRKALEDAGKAGPEDE